MSQPLQIQLPAVKEWCTKETASMIAPLKDKAASLLREVRARIDDTVESSSRLMENSKGEMDKNNPKIYRFARNANKFAENLNDKIAAVAIPDDTNYEKLQTLCGELEKTASTLEQLRGGAYPYISPYFIFDRRRLDVSLKRLFDIIKELRNFLTTKYAKARTVEDVDTLVDKLAQTIKEAKQNEENRRVAEEKQRTIEKDMAETLQIIEQVQAKAELIELLKTNQRIAELRENVKHNLRYLQKPFFKLQSLARTSEVAIPLDEMNKLSDYLNDPFLALATEEDGYATLKSVLKKLDTTIAQGKLKLKSTRLRKAQDQINNILNKDSIGQLQTNCKEALFQRKQLLASEVITALQNQLTQHQSRLKELQKENEFSNSRNKALQEEQRKLQERTEYLRKELERNIFQLTNKNVHIASTG